MLILHEALDLEPASPAAVDAVVALASDRLIPLCEEHEASLIGAFTCDADRYAQVQHLHRFENLEGFAAFRERAQRDAAWVDCQAELDALAPRRFSTLLEPLGPIAPEKLDAAIDRSQQRPAQVYSLASLEVVPGRMDDFAKLLAASADALPIAACLQPVFGNRQVIWDLWTTALARDPYAPATDAMRPFFDQLRAVAPDERLVNWTALPYSQLL
jgi:hypothetical protein